MILIVLFAMLFGIIALRFMTDHGDYVKVPDLKGKTLDSVTIELDKLDLKYIFMTREIIIPITKIFQYLISNPSLILK